MFVDQSTSGTKVHRFFIVKRAVMLYFAGMVFTGKMRILTIQF
jgi:hypothetical protein